MKQEEIAQRVGKNRATVSNAIRLLDLDPEVQTLVSRKMLTSGHAKALLGLKPKAEQRIHADLVLKPQVNVAQTQHRLTAASTGTTVKTTNNQKHPTQPDPTTPPPTPPPPTWGTSVPVRKGPSGSPPPQRSFPSLLGHARTLTPLRFQRALLFLAKQKPCRAVRTRSAYVAPWSPKLWQRRAIPELKSWMEGEIAERRALDRGALTGFLRRFDGSNPGVLSLTVPYDRQLLHFR